MNVVPIFLQLSDAQLVEEVARLAQSERRCTVELVASLLEFDRRQLFLPAGYRSLFSYCTVRLGLAEGAAYSRIEAARAAQRFPILLEKLAEGSITLSTVGLLSRHLTPANCLSLLDESRGKSKREVERIVARLRPQPDAPSLIRRMPAAAFNAREQPAGALSQAVDLLVSSSVYSAVGPPASSPVSLPVHSPAAGLTTPVSLPASSRPVIAPLTAERFKLQITMDQRTHDTLREIQDLMRHSVPTGDAAVIVARGLKLLREHLLRQKAAQVTRPRVVTRAAALDGRPTALDGRRSRHIPAEVRRRVWERDHGQCAFVGADGRCDARGLLEFHHMMPFAGGGESTERNIELRCRGHNAHEAELFFGSVTSAKRREAG